MLGLFPEPLKVIVQSNIFCLGVCHKYHDFHGKGLVRGAIPCFSRCQDARHNQIPEVPLDAEQFLLSFL